MSKKSMNAVAETETKVEVETAPAELSPEEFEARFKLELVGYRYTASRIDAVKALIDAGYDADATKSHVMAGCMARQLGLAPTVESFAEARRVMALSGAGSKVPDRRTNTQETAYTNVRQDWKRLRAKAEAALNVNLKTDNRGGARPKSEASKSETPAQATEVVPVATTPKDLFQRVSLAANQIEALCLKNDGMKHSKELLTLAQEFRTKLEALKIED